MNRPCRLAPACRTGNVPASAKFPQRGYFFDLAVRRRGVGNRNEVSIVQSNGAGASFPFMGFRKQMDQLSGYVHRPLQFVLRYLRRRPLSHLLILVTVVAAVACSVGTQYGVKYLVDCLSAGRDHAAQVWLAFAFLMSLIIADNFLWRIASWT